jgi:hypothetical protein
MIRFILALTAALLLAGCSSTDKTSTSPFYVGPVSIPQPPAFLTGPAVVLLTNQTGFTAHITATTPYQTAPGTPASGQLFGSGGRLLLAPDIEKTERERSRTGGISYLWDVANGTGFLLSEALQAYAPWSANDRVTNLTWQTEASAQQNLSGHPCRSQQAVVSTAKGETSFQVWRATDLHGFPVRISADTNLSPLTLKLSAIDLRPPPAELFQLPQGFTRYASVEAMMTELTLRQHNLKLRPSEWYPTDLTQPNPAYGK